MKTNYCLLYTFVFMGIGVLTTLIGQYLDHVGFTGQQIGAVTAAGTCTAIFASPFWGRRYSVLCAKADGSPLQSAGGRYLLVAAVCVCAALIALGLPQIRTFVWFLPAYILLYFFQAPVSSLMDTLTVDDGLRFGHIRTFGAIGFAVACAAAAFLAEHLGIVMIFPAYAVCFMAAAAVVLLIRKGNKSRQMPDEGASAMNEAGTCPDEAAFAEPAPAEQKSGMTLTETAKQLITNRPYVILVICAFFINGTDVANNTYFSFLYLDGGGTLAGVGLAFLLMAGSEAPFMAASDWFCDRLGQGRILLIAMVFSIVRFAIFALGPSSGILLLLFPLQGLVNGITLVEYVKFVARVVPVKLHGVGIAVYYALGSSFSTIVCQLIGGRLLDGGAGVMSGAQSVYLFFALFNIVGVIIFVIAGMHKRNN